MDWIPAQQLIWSKWGIGEWTWKWLSVTHSVSVSCWLTAFCDFVADLSLYADIYVDLNSYSFEMSGGVVLTILKMQATIQVKVFVRWYYKHSWKTNNYSNNSETPCTDQSFLHSSEAASAQNCTSDPVERSGSLTLASWQGPLQTSGFKAPTYMPGREM